MPNSRKPLLHGEVTRSILGAFYEVYGELGFGFLESVYGECLDVELATRGHSVRREVWVTVQYKGRPVSLQRVDRIIDDKVLVELKSTQLLHPSTQRITYNYLRATRYEVGLVLHFGPEPKFHRLVYSNPGTLSPTFNADQADVG